MPIAWLLLQPVKMFVEGSKVSAVATMWLLLFWRSLVFSQENFHLQKAQRKKISKFKGKSAEVFEPLNYERAWNLLTFFSHFLWEIHCIGYFSISWWDNNKISKGQKYKAQLCPWTHTWPSIVCHGDLTAMTGCLDDVQASYLTSGGC